jgi:mRNA-degrading endonuclease YafQ of YafQ-DinJ toxin-antitoxin module
VMDSAVRDIFVLLLFSRKTIGYSPNTL